MHTEAPSPRISSINLSRASGLTYRQCDYWIRVGVLQTMDGRDEPGSGAQRSFAPEEVTVACVLAALRDLNVPLDTLKRVAEQLRLFDEDGWTGTLYVDTNGWISRDQPNMHAAYVINLDLFAANA